jgi:hypothetical protein
MRRTMAQRLDHEVVSSQRPDGAHELVRRLAEGALAHDHEHGRRPTRRRSRQLTHVGSFRSASILSRRTPSRRDQPDRQLRDAAAVHTVFIDGRAKKKLGGELFEGD